MRIQKDRLERYFLSSPDIGTKRTNVQIKISFYEILGGYLRCRRLNDPFNMTSVLDNLQQKPSPNEKRIILYNTGMHDIHRLCDNYWMKDRELYLTSAESRNNNCFENYQLSIELLTKDIQQIPATVRIFQTTTAAWPKYGNWGITWDPRYGQNQPLDSHFVNEFNEIAIHVINQHNKEQEKRQLRDTSRRIRSKTKSMINDDDILNHQQENNMTNNNKNNNIIITDTYWMTLSRPDNREIDKRSEIGKKLSHPGLEVIDAIIRIWFTLAIQLLVPYCT
jgi:hypothetical protein